MLLGLALIIMALLWAYRLRREAAGADVSLRGPWIMGLAGVCWFLFYVWLITLGGAQP